MNKKILLILIIILLFTTANAAITNLKIPLQVRLGEKLTISGNQGTADTLCKFVILDSNDFAIERLSDEYTFLDGSFYSERQLIEPPYYRGDDFNVNVTCGTDKAFQIFTVNQRLSLVHPIQQEWDWIFEENNQAALMILFGSVGFIILLILVTVFFIKLGRSYAS